MRLPPGVCYGTVASLKGISYLPAAPGNGPAFWAARDPRHGDQTRPIAVKLVHASTRLLIAALIIAAALTASGTAAARTQSPRARVARVLRQLGYRELHLSCSRKGICRWHGVRGGRSCSGKVTAGTRRHTSIRFSAIRCAGSPPPPLALGFNTYNTPLTVAKQRAVGATVTRLFVNWWDVEPQKGGWSWNSTDLQYKQILAGGIRPLLVVNGAPCWATASCNLVFGSPPTTSHDGDWSAYVRAVTARYPQAVGVEVWNEPNLSGTFYPQADPRRYTQLLSEAYTAVKSVNRNMPVISGGLAMDDGSGSAFPGYASRTFLADMYADGARRYMDGLGIHVYPTDTQSNGARVWDTAAMSRWLQQVKDVSAAAGVSPAPIWITEMGVSTATESGFPPAVTPDEQATDLLSMIHLAQAGSNVRAAIIDSLQDAASDPIGNALNSLTWSLINFDVSYNGVEAGLGVYTNYWTPKPAACALSKAMGGSLKC
jgi:hypothetical protein